MTDKLHVDATLVAAHRMAELQAENERLKERIGDLEQNLRVAESTRDAAQAASNRNLEAKRKAETANDHYAALLASQEKRVSAVDKQNQELHAQLAVQPVRMNTSTVNIVDSGKVEHNPRVHVASGTLIGCSCGYATDSEESLARHLGVAKIGNVVVRPSIGVGWTQADIDKEVAPWPTADGGAALAERAVLPSDPQTAEAPGHQCPARVEQLENHPAGCSCTRCTG
jgi:hypothetical protein